MDEMNLPEIQNDYFSINSADLSKNSEDIVNQITTSL